jgi:hypothetical protein
MISILLTSTFPFPKNLLTVVDDRLHAVREVVSFSGQKPSRVAWTSPTVVEMEVAVTSIPQSDFEECILVVWVQVWNAIDRSQ